MGHPNSTVFMSSPITRQSSLLNSFNHSLTGSVPEAVRKNLTAIILNWSLIKLCTHKYFVPYMVHPCQGAEVSNYDELHMPFRHRSSSASSASSSDFNTSRATQAFLTSIYPKSFGESCAVSIPLGLHIPF